MRWSLFAAAVLAGSLLALPEPASAQSTGTASPAPARAGKAAGTKREPTAGQMAARDRMKKCAAEWKDAKAKGATGGAKWPQYWSKCNARLKGGTA